MIKAIFWDFDGVILDSMPVRDFGFRQIFKKYDDILVNEFIQYHRKNGGLSRFHKIRYFYNHMLNKEISDNRIQEYANEFSEIMREELTNHKYLIVETIKFIKDYYQNAIFHIVSGSEQNELRYLCNKLDLAKYFKTIEGSPTPKNDLVKNRLNLENYNSKEAILIGDSFNDYEAAKINGLKFFGFNNSELKTKDLYIESFEKINFEEFFCK